MFVSVLILDAGGTQALPIAESLYKAGFDIHGFLVINYLMDMGLVS